MAELKTTSELISAARSEGNAVVVAVRGEIDLQNSPELRTELIDLLAKHAPQSGQGRPPGPGPLAGPPG